MKLPIYLACSTQIITQVLTLKILVVFPVPARSHYILGNALAKGLANAGHDTTIVGAFSEKRPPENFREIVLEEFVEEKKKNQNVTNMYEMENVSPIFQILFLNYVGQTVGDGFFSHPKIQAWLKSNDRYDVVIIEEFMNDALKILAHHFKAPLVIFSTIGPNRWVNNLVGNPEPPSYIPDVFISSPGQMNFFERAYNFLLGLVHEMNLKLYFYPKQNALMKKYFPGAPDLDDLLYNASLVLTNSHESIHQAVPHVPNMIDIGGFHVSPPEDLPADLKDFVDDAEEGIIYFSMGSNLVPSQMPRKTQEAILKVLGSRKERVLWKWDEDNLPNKPANIKISKWFPQQAILAHPNTRLFITHGGLLSTTETIFFGVPVLAFPIFGDQKLNAARAASLGFGKYLPFSQIDENNVAIAVHELLDDPKYRENAKLRSRLMHDRPVKPMDLAIWWIEYVVRHKGAPHLRVAGIKLPFYQYLMLDVICVLIASVLLVVYLLWKLWSSCGKLKTKEGTKSKKKQQ